jgi:Inner membrane component of T3SS, cytoplasmic domain
MFELALSFKGRPLSVHPLRESRLLVGRDPGCDLVIDSLAVAPQHLALQGLDGRVVLVALTADYPVLRNGRRVVHAVLEDGDRIQVGKHTLTFAERVQASDPAPPADSTAVLPAPPPRASGAAEAYLQIQSGPHIGEILILARAVTRLRRLGGTGVIVIRREGGYALARLGESNRVIVDRELVLEDQEVPLTHGASIEIDGLRCQFFQALVSSAA